MLLALAAAGATAAAGGPDAVAILPDSAREALMTQCSRPVPEPGEAGWAATEADVAAVEAALPAALAAHRMRDPPDWSRLETGWRRQYIGFVRGGRRLLYGNFFPREVGDEGAVGQWRVEPVIVCDGGPAFFGVEYDVEAAGITALDFNGPG